MAHGTKNVTPILYSLESPLSWMLKGSPEVVQMPGMHAQEPGSGSRASSGLTFLYPFKSSLTQAGSLVPAINISMSAFPEIFKF